MNDCDLFFTETLFPWLKDFGFDSHFRTSRNNVGTWYSDTPNWHATRQETCAVIRHSIWHTDTLIHWCFDSVGVRYLQKLLNLDYGRIALGLAWLRTSSSPFDTDTAKHFWSPTHHTLLILLILWYHRQLLRYSRYLPRRNIATYWYSDTSGSYFDTVDTCRGDISQLWLMFSHR